MTADSQSASPSRVAVVGPVPPYRGGIAQHTAHLAEALAERAEVLLLSFARQYPAWLYPGSSDRDPAAQAPLRPAPEFLLDPLNPLSWRRALARIERYLPDLVLLPWWTVFWAPCFWFLARGCRLRGLPVRLLCHNVLDHEAAAWKTWLTCALFRQVDSFLVHSRAEARRLTELIGGAEIRVHPHPLYDGFPDPIETLPRRADLELLFFGLVRPYKGLPQLIEAMGRLRDLSVQLSVVGEFWEGQEAVEKAVRAKGLDERVELVPRYVTAQEAADRFARADAVVLPYLSVTASGVVALAYRYGKPVIASRLDGLAELVRDGETGALVPPGDPTVLAEAIRGFSAARARAMRPAIASLTRGMTWDSLARCLLQPASGSPRRVPVASEAA